jgi:uncharacterized protein (DUF1697 family)
MALVVFLRGVNVGGHKAFRPAALARELAALEVVNVGAAGTFVVRAAIAQARLRAELVRRLPFQTEIMICPARDLAALASRDPFPSAPPDGGAGRFLSVMARRPRTLPRLPLRRPDDERWQIKIVRISGRFALSLWRRQGGTMLYPNEVVERSFGLDATTRNWNTVSTICKILREG